MLTENTLKRAGGQSPERGFAAQVGPVFFLAAIFLLNFIARIIFSPLLPTMERELAISHKQAGLLFFLDLGGLSHRPAQLRLSVVPFDPSANHIGFQYRCRRRIAVCLIDD